MTLVHESMLSNKGAVNGAIPTPTSSKQKANLILGQEQI